MSIKVFPLIEVEAVRGDGPLLKALRALRAAINDTSSRTVAGEGVLAGGVAEVTVPGLQAVTRIVPGYAKRSGTTGALWCDPGEYDISRKTAVIRSSSATDASTVTWLAVT